MPATKAHARALGINNAQAIRVEFARRLSYAIDECGYTPSSFARECSLAQSTINRYLAALKLPGTEALRVMAAVLGVTADWLIVLAPDDRRRINVDLSATIMSLKAGRHSNVPVRNPARPVPAAEEHGGTPW